MYFVKFISPENFIKKTLKNEQDMKPQSLQKKNKKERKTLINGTHLYFYH